MEKYRLDLKCRNCGKNNFNVEIPMGTTIEEHGEKENPLCDRCGCSIIRQKQKKE